MKKPVLLITILALMLTLVTATGFAADNEISVTVNGEKIEFLQAPIIKNGTTFVPIRAILEALGQEVTWDQNTKTATAEYKKTDMTTMINADSNLVITSQNSEDRTYKMPAMPMIVKGTTLVPVRAVSEIFAKNVAWDQASQIVKITDATVLGDVKLLEKDKSASVVLKDLEALQYSTDGKATYKIEKNKDFIFLDDISESVGLHTLYFRAENVNKDAKIEMKITKEDKTTETITYKTAIADPCDTAVELVTGKAVDVKVGNYVKATVKDNSSSTGYQWFITSLPAGLQLVEDKALAKATLDGASVDYAFVFKVVGEGDMKLQLTNKRSWEEKSNSEKVVEFEIKAKK